MARGDIIVCFTYKKSKFVLQIVAAQYELLKKLQESKNVLSKQIAETVVRLAKTFFLHSF